MTTLTRITPWILTLGLCAAAGCAALPGDDAAGDPAASATAAAPGDHTGQAVQALTGNHKVCSAIVPDKFRDSIEVDDGWSSTTCFGWAQGVTAGTGTWQMGCLFTNGFSWGGGGGGIPSPNCGW